MILVLAASLMAMAADGAAAKPPAAKPSATAALYKTHCQSCHMVDGDSPLEVMNFVDDAWKHGSDPAKVAAVIAKGVPGTAMLEFGSKLKPAEVRALAAYVRAFDKTLKPAKAVPKKTP
jgi:mono/diheme cytochrome c family protein